MKKFNMAGAQFKSLTNPNEIADRISAKKPVEEVPQEAGVAVVELTKESQLPQKFQALQGLVSKIKTNGKVVLTEDTLKKLNRWHNTRRGGGSREIPLLCEGKNCMYSKQCPLIAAGLDLAVLEPCALEEHLLEQWTSDTAKSVRVKANDPAFSIDMRSIGHSSLLEVLVRRNSMEMSEDPAVVEQVIVGVDPKTGAPLMGKQVNEHVKEMQNLIKAEEGVHSSLLATRKAKAAAGKSIHEQEEEYMDGAADFADEIEADFEVMDGSDGTAKDDGNPDQAGSEAAEGRGEPRDREPGGDAKPGDESPKEDS